MRLKISPNNNEEFLKTFNLINRIIRSGLIPTVEEFSSWSEIAQELYIGNKNSVGEAQIEEEQQVATEEDKVVTEEKLPTDEEREASLQEALKEWSQEIKEGGE